MRRRGHRQRTHEPLDVVKRHLKWLSSARHR
jgi:hypothetical protein